MRNTYVKKTNLLQKKIKFNANSIIDSSSQSESLQRNADIANNAAQREEVPHQNNTGMPDNLKAGIESLSGFSMDDVRVHYNSSKPATVQALAYTQGTDIHVAPGQEKHLPHEAWHVAQQMAGRVSPTTNINGMPVNDNASLEHEADVMGEMAVKQRKESPVFINKKTSCFDIAGIQRFPDQTGLPDGYVVDGDGSWKSGCKIHHSEYVYTGVANSDGRHNEKINALKAISEKAGNLGSLTKKDKALELKTGEFFDATFHAQYKTSTGSSVVLALTYNFRNGKAPKDTAGGPGYITQVSRIRTKGESEYKKTAKMINAPEGVTDDLLQTPDNGQYYNKHRHTTGFTPDGEPQTVLNETSSSHKDFKDLAPDSYTKLAGEGARFLCVRNNMQSLQHNSVFWDTVLNCGIRFEDLYRSWAYSFSSEFNITDQMIHDKLTEMRSETGEYKLITRRVYQKKGRPRTFYAKAVDASDPSPRINLNLSGSSAPPHIDETEDETEDKKFQPPAKEPRLEEQPDPKLTTTQKL